MVPKQDYYSYAFDNESHLIHAEKAIKGNEYRCPNCGRKMIPKQGEKRVWHFAHKANTENCSYETYLHKLAKRRICECFNESAHFMIQCQSKLRCNVDCPLGAKQPCEWNENEKDLKQYYDLCVEEKQVDKYRADLLISNSKEGDKEPILIEIWVKHKSTEEKLNSGLQIIEINIESEEDIEEIVNTASKIQNQNCVNGWENKVHNDKILFYNFKKEFFAIPDVGHQPYKHVFWIDSKGYYHFSDGKCEDVQLHTESLKCLDLNPPEIENSIFRIESRDPIDIILAFHKLVNSDLSFSSCKLCENYKWKENAYKCILYKLEEPSQYSAIHIPAKCTDFKLRDFFRSDSPATEDLNQECKITIRK